MKDKLYGYTINDWMLAALDILDGNSSPYDIHSQTGLPMDRCNELSKMFGDATKNGWPKKDTYNCFNLIYSTHKLNGY